MNQTGSFSPCTSYIPRATCAASSGAISYKSDFRTGWNLTGSENWDTFRIVVGDNVHLSNASMSLGKAAVIQLQFCTALIQKKVNEM